MIGVFSGDGCTKQMYGRGEEKTGTTEEDLCVDHQMPRHVEARHQPPDQWIHVAGHQTHGG
jgi:hypothetical protein